MGAAMAVATEILSRPYLRLASSGANDNGGSKDQAEKSAAVAEDLDYRIEIWDAQGTTIERVLAITAGGTLGYAAYYAALREYPRRIITLRYRHQVLSRSATA